MPMPRTAATETISAPATPGIRCVAAACPLCDAAGPHKVLLKVRHLSPFNPGDSPECRIDAVRCDRCGMLRLDLVVCTSETLYPHQRAFIQKTFGCRIVDEYGCSEMGPIALECPEGGMHLSMENILVEFAESGAGPEHAEIFLTNLNRFAMPMLRYEIGDTGQLLNRRCPCGRQLDIMSFDAGRVLSVLMAAGRHYLAGSVFCYIAFDIIMKHGGIKDFRVVQKARDAMEITLVKDATFREEILEMFTGRVREKFGAAMRIEYRFVAEIPPEKSGKRLFVSSEIPESR